jgi:hypothetical protein
MLRWGAWLAAAAVLACAARAAELTTDGVALLARKGLGEEVLLAAVERSGQTFRLSVEEILRLKEAGVTD